MACHQLRDRLGCEISPPRVFAFGRVDQEDIIANIIPYLGQRFAENILGGAGLGRAFQRQRYTIFPKMWQHI